jgi:hypothetical protein
MSKTTFILLLILTFCISSSVIYLAINIFFKVLLFIITSPLQALIALVAIWIASFIIKKIIKTILC